MQNVQIEHFNRISFVFGQKSISFAYAHTHITVNHENIVEKHNKSNRGNDNVASQLFLQFPTFLQSHQRFIKNTKHFMSHSAFIEQKVTDPSITAQRMFFNSLERTFVIGSECRRRAQ